MPAQATCADAWDDETLVPQQRREKRQKAKQSASSHRKSRGQDDRPRTPRKNTVCPNVPAPCKEKTRAARRLPLKGKKPGKSKSLRLHRFHKEAFGAWLDVHAANRDRWTKSSRRLDGGSVMKEQWLEELNRIEVSEMEGMDLLFNVVPVSPNKPQQMDLSVTNSRATLGLLEATGILPKLWPPFRIMQGMRVCKWLRQELATSAEHIVLQTTGKANLKKSKEQEWNLLLGKQPFTTLASEAVQGPSLEVSQFDALSALEISFCCRPQMHAMEVLGRAVQHADVLVSLTLRGNALGSCPNFEQIEWLRFCKSLRHLDLAENGLNIPWRSWEWRRPRLTALATALSHLGGSLEQLHLDGNALTGPAMAVLAAGMESCTQLRFLSLQEFTLYDFRAPLGDEGATALASALRHFKQLQHLELGRQGIQIAGLVAVGSALEGCSDLSYLGLGRNGISTAGAEWLVEALGGLRVRVELGGHAGVDARRVLETVCSAGAAWTGVGLRGAHCGDPRGEQARTDFFARMERRGGGRVGAMAADEGEARSGITDLDLGSLGGHRGMCGGVLDSARVWLRALQTLSLDGTRLVDDSLEELAAALEGHEELEKLSMRGSLAGGCSSAVVIRLLGVLGAVPTLQALELGGNGLSGAVASAMQHGLSSGGAGFLALRELGLSENKLRDAESVEGVCGLLRGCRGLERLDLQDNAIGGPGVAKLVAAVKARHAGGCGHVALNLRQNRSNEWSPRELVRLLGGRGLSALELSRGDYSPKGNGKPKYEGGGEGWRLACWLMGWRAWAHCEVLADARVRTLAAQGLTVYSEE